MKTINVKNWYCATYPDCELGKTLNPLVTFFDVWQVMHHKHLGIYTLLGVISSDIKKRVFEEMVARQYCYNTDYLETLFLFGTQEEA